MFVSSVYFTEPRVFVKVFSRDRKAHFAVLCLHLNSKPFYSERQAETDKKIVLNLIQCSQTGVEKLFGSRLAIKVK